MEHQEVETGFVTKPLAAPLDPEEDIKASRKWLRLRVEQENEHRGVRLTLETAHSIAGEILDT